MIFNRQKILISNASEVKERHEGGQMYENARNVSIILFSSIKQNISWVHQFLHIDNISYTFDDITINVIL